MRLVFFAFAFLGIVFTGCAETSDSNAPDAHPQGGYDVIRRLEETYYDGSISLGGAGMSESHLVVDFDSAEGAFSLQLQPAEEGDLHLSFRDVRVHRGYFEGWTTYAFAQNDVVIAPLFYAIRGHFSIDPSERRSVRAALALYFSKGANNDLAVPWRREVYRIESR